jgi:P-type Ca2+ transporter type 2C
MATTQEALEPSSPERDSWYAVDPAEVVARLGVDVVTGLSGTEAAERLARDGPNMLPVEQPPSSLRRFLGEYTSYMQLILVGAAVVSPGGSGYPKL